MNRLKVMRDKCNAAIESMNVTDLQKLAMKAALGIEVRAEDMLASDLRITRHTALYLEARIQSERLQHPDRHFFFVTGFDDTFLTTDAKPDLRSKAIMLKATNMIRKWEGVSAILRLEMQPVSNYEDNSSICPSWQMQLVNHGIPLASTEPLGESAQRSRLIMPHVHGFGWTDRQDFCPHAVMAEHNRSGAWRSSLGGKPVHILPLRHGESISRTLHYLIKLPNSAKNRIKLKNGRVDQRDIQQDYTPELALRMLEGFSQVPFKDTLVAIGGACPIKNDLLRDLTLYHRSRAEAAALPSGFDFAGFWSDLRAAHGTRRYGPWQIDCRALRKTRVQPIAVAATPTAPSEADVSTQTPVDAAPSVSAPLSTEDVADNLNGFLELMAEDTEFEDVTDDEPDDEEVERPRRRKSAKPASTRDPSSSSSERRSGRGRRGDVTGPGSRRGSSRGGSGGRGTSRRRR
jgi:hypothetical protein